MQVTVAQLRAPERVVVAERDGGERHVPGITLVQHGDVVILLVVYDTVHYLHEEHGDRQQEDHRPQAPADAEVLVLHEDVVGTMEGAAVKKRGKADIGHFFFFRPIVCVRIVTLLLVLAVFAISWPPHTLVVIIEAALAWATNWLVVGAEGDGACDPYHDVKSKTGQ